MSKEWNRILIYKEVPISDKTSFRLENEFVYYTEDPPEIFKVYVKAAEEAGCTVRKFKFIQEEL